MLILGSYGMFQKHCFSSSKTGFLKFAHVKRLSRSTVFASENEVAKPLSRGADGGVDALHIASAHQTDPGVVTS